MASAQDVLKALAMAYRALDEIRPEPAELGANELLRRISTLSGVLSRLESLATTEELSKSDPTRDRAVESVLAAVGRLMPPSVLTDPVPERLRRVEGLATALNELHRALSDPTTDPNK